MGLSVFKTFDETRPGAWLLAGSGGLLAALLGFHRTTEYSLFMAGFSLLAVGVSAGMSSRKVDGFPFVERPKWLPVGSLGVWIGAIVLTTLNPNMEFDLNERRLFIAAGVLLFSLVYQGRLTFFAPLPIAGLIVGLQEMDLSPRQVLSNSTALGFMFSFPLATLIMMIRSSRADSDGAVIRLKSLVDVSEDLHQRVQVQTEALVNLRENLLGTVASIPSKVESARGSASVSILTSQPTPSISFENLIAEVRHIFSEYQIQGRALGKISGPIRFVFFPPIAGFDNQSEIAVDIANLRAGLWNCLELAYESLPEIGALRREGVIRLSIRHGFRVIEIAIEDNGRGIQTRNLDAQHGLLNLRREIESRGGRFDRIARLGVGSRTSLELRILSEKPANSRYRATIKHPFTVGESVPQNFTNKESSPSGGGRLV